MLSSNNRLSRGWEQARTVGLLLVGSMVALGEWTEAVSLIGDGVDSLRSQFTHTVEYDQLQRLHVGNTRYYTEALFGQPQVTRQIDDGIEVNYFHQDKYLLTVFFDGDRVAAYTVLALVDGFELPIGEGQTLGGMVLEQLSDNVEQFVVDQAITGSLYLESGSAGRSGLYLHRYLGSLNYGKPELKIDLTELYEAEVYGSEEQARNARALLRARLQPNWFGVGELKLPQIQKSLLSVAEFQVYFGRAE